MLDYQRIIDDLRSGIRHGGEPTPETLASLGEYGDACRKANDRLRQCESMLRKGLRGEAIQLAEIEPNLLDLLATLDFPDRDQVAAELQHRGHVLPPLYTDGAAELNEAYAAQQPLEALLGQHRYLALAHAPLKERLMVLRKIGTADVTNPVWNDDIAAYEGDRLKEIQGEASRALKARDLSKLDALHAELTGFVWIQEPPPALVRKIKEAAGEVQRSIARDELTKLQAELNRAHSAADVRRGREVRELWDATAVVSRLSADDPLVVGATPALQWLATQDAQDAAERSFQQATAELQRALDAAASEGGPERSQLESLYRTVRRQNFDMPAPLERRYAAHLRQLDAASKRGRRLRMVVITGVVLLVAGGVGYGVVVQMRGRELDDAEATLAALVDRAKQDPAKTAEVEAYLTDLKQTKPHVAAAKSIQQLAGRFHGEVAEEQSRAAAFRTALSRAQNSDPLRPDRTALDQASSQARFDEEKAEVAKLEAEFAEAALATQGKTDEAYVREVQDIARRVADLEGDGSRDLNKLEAAIRLIEGECEALPTKHARASAAVTVQIQPVIRRLTAVKAAATRLRDEIAGMAAITRSIGRQDEYVASLQKFASGFPGGGRASDFKKVLAESAQWSLIESWNRQESAMAAIVTRAPAGDSREAAKEIRRAAKALERIPSADGLIAAADYLEGLAGRKDDSNVSTLISLENSFSNPLLTELWLLKLRSGKERFYLTEELKLGAADSQSFQFIEDYSGKTRQAFRSAKDIDQVVKAPHCAMTAEVSSELARMSKGGHDAWEPGIAAMIRAIYKAEEAEPVLRLALLKRIVEVGCRGSFPLQQSLQAELKLLENTEANLLVNWMKPGDGDAELAADTARKELRKLADLPVHAAAAVDKAAALRDKALKSTRYEWVGCLLSETGGQWRCETGPVVPAGDGRLVVMTPDVAAGSVLQVVGLLDRGTLQVASTDRTLLVEGRPVWLERVSVRNVSGE